MASITDNRFAFADLCRVLACFGVILGHCCDGFVRNYANLPLRYWLYAHFLGSISCMAAPLFVLLSGSLLLKPQGTFTFQDMKRRLIRILVPLAVWSFVYLCFLACRRSPLFQLHFNQPEMRHLWFVYMMVGLYLFLPIFKAIYDAFSTQHTLVYYFCFIWLAITCFPSHLPLEIFGWIKQPYLFGYGGYFLIGAFIAHVGKDFGSSKAWKALYVVSLSFTFFSVWYDSFQTHKMVHKHYSNFSLGVVFASIAFFVLLYRVGSFSNILTKFLSFISDKVFIIYFFHGLVLSLVYPFILGNQTTAVFLLPFWALAIFLVSLGCAVILRYIPKSKVLFG